jgi:hypothetical protein
MYIYKYTARAPSNALSGDDGGEFCNHLLFKYSSPFSEMGLPMVIGTQTDNVRHPVGKRDDGLMAIDATWAWGANLVQQFLINHTKCRF